MVAVLSTSKSVMSNNYTGSFLVFKIGYCQCKVLKYRVSEMGGW